MRINDSLRAPLQTISETIMTADQQRLLGNNALAILAEQFSIENSEAKNPCLAEVLHQLPCIHSKKNWRRKNPIVDISEISLKWLRNQFFEMEESTFRIQKAKVQMTNMYSAYHEKFDKYITLVNKVPEIRRILDSALDELNDLGISKEDENGFQTQSIPSRPFTHPRQNCESGAQKGKPNTDAVSAVSMDITRHSTKMTGRTKVNN